MIEWLVQGLLSTDVDATTFNARDLSRVRGGTVQGLVTAATLPPGNVSEKPQKEMLVLVVD